MSNQPFSAIERRIILERFVCCGFSPVACAHSLGLGKTTIYRKLAEYGYRKLEGEDTRKAILMELQGEIA